MSNDNQKPRRLIVPLQRSPDGAVVRIDRVNNVSGMIDRALNIVDEQLTKIALKSRQAGNELDEKEIRKLETLIKSLATLSKEEREREKGGQDAEGLSDLTPEELVKLAETELLKIKDTKR